MADDEVIITLSGTPEGKVDIDIQFEPPLPYDRDEDDQTVWEEMTPAQKLATQMLSAVADEVSKES